LFFIATDRHGTGLFRTDPSYSQVVRVSDVEVKGDGVNPDEIGVIGTTVFFSGTDGTHGVELWKTEPPYTNAVEVADINPEGDSFPKYFASISNALFFQATDNKTGFELWKSLPPYTSATQVVDLNPGSPGSDPAYLVNIGWTLFFRCQRFQRNGRMESRTTLRCRSYQAGIEHLSRTRRRWPRRSSGRCRRHTFL